MEASRYRVIRRIGVGGMAEVLEAVAVGASGFERRVALKRMLPIEGDAAREHRMFLDEARIASHLHHANIVAVTDYGLADGRPFQVLEYVDGVDVRRLLEREPLPIALALHIALAVAHALDHAHTAVDAHGTPLGIVHRDVTPANILISRAGDVKLTDFGIAFAYAKSEQTLVGTTKGTPWFMSPEQMMGDPTEARSDIFSLGCVLHMMITGSSPLERQSQQIHVAGGAEVELAGDVPADVRAIIERATRHAVAARFASTRDLVAALATATARYPVVDPRTALREWAFADEGRGSQPIVPAGPGKLDALLDLALILDGDNRTFETVATRNERVLADEPEPATHVRPPKRSRTRAIAALTLIALALGTGAFLVARRLAASDATTASANEPVPIAVDEPRDAAVTALDGVVALVPPDAAVAIVEPVVAPSRPVVAKRTAEPPPTNAQTQRWIRLHGKAARGFADWVTASPDAARALRAWDSKTHDGGALITWLVQNRGLTVADYADAHPDSGLDAVVKRHADDLIGIRKWCRKFDRQALNLASQGGGLPWP